jgi:signal transduction histidine kinase
MRIKSKVWISIGSSLVISAVIIFFIASILGEVRLNLALSEKYNTIINQSLNLNSLIDTFRVRPTKSVIHQLNDVNTNLRAMLTNMTSSDAREKFLLNQIKDNYEDLNALVELFFQDKAVSDVGLEAARKLKLATQLRIKARSIADDTSRLIALNKVRIQANQGRAFTLVLVLIGAVILTNAAIFFVTSSSTVRDILRLGEGVKRVSTGDLAHRVSVHGRNEIADLAGGFNDMAASLQASYGRLSRYTVKLEQSNRELQDFAYVASHDLQEPLRKIQVFSGRVREENQERLDETSLDFLDRVVNAAQRMQHLIEALLEYSRIATKQQPFRPVDLGQVAREVAGDLDALVAQTRGRIEVGSMPVIEADAVQMRQVLQNLVANALKYHRPDTPPQVRVEGRCPDPDAESAVCEITVSDNGIGFDERYLDKIFTPFQRLHGKKQYQGTGMGLAIVRRIVERHGGTVTARSTPGTGSAFVVTLPMAREGEGVNPEEGLPPQGPE